MKFKLQAIESVRSGTGEVPTVHTVEFDLEYLPEIVEKVQDFLLGCGFSLKNLDYDIPSPGCF